MTLNLDKNLNKFCQMLYVKGKNINQSPVDSPWTFFFNKLIILLNILRTIPPEVCGLIRQSSIVILSFPLESDLFKIMFIKAKKNIALIWKWNLNFHHFSSQYWVMLLKLNVSAYKIRLSWLRVCNSKISDFNLKI